MRYFSMIKSRENRECANFVGERALKSRKRAQELGEKAMLHPAAEFLRR